MKMRHSFRYVTASLPVELTAAEIVLPDKTTVPAIVENLSPLGIKLTVKGTDVRSVAICRNNIVTVRLSSGLLEAAGLCVWSGTTGYDEPDLAFYFFKPHEQNYLHKLLHILELPSYGEGGFEDLLWRDIEEQRFVPHEWEEVVEKLCQSKDPELQATGLREMERIKNEKH